MRIWTHNSLRWVYTSWFLFLNLCSTGRCWGIAFSIFFIYILIKRYAFFFFPLKTSKTNYSWAQKSSSLTKRHLNWGSAADNTRSETTVSQNGVSGFHYLREWRRGESSGAAAASAPTQPCSDPECCVGSQGMWVCSGLWGSSASPHWQLQLSGHHSQGLKSWGKGRRREKLFFKLLQGDWIPSAVPVLKDLLLE